MPQSLLADRFKLQVHWDTRELPLSSLSVAKGGPKLRHSEQPEDDTLAYGRRMGRWEGGAVGIGCRTNPYPISLGRSRVSQESAPAGG